MKTPMVSIGLPVYNGERFIKDAIESILNQKFSDLELIICDNASCDDTENICKEYLKKDPRIRYLRNAQNIGAAANFNKSFYISQGKYFKWASHDDMIKEDFIHKCYKILEENSEAVLAYPKTLKIDENNKEIDYYNIKLPTDSDDPPTRYNSLLGFGYKCYEVFGLIRSDQLRKTGLIGNFSHADGVLLAQLSLLGKFVQVPEYLFLSRMHSNQSESIYSRKGHDYRAWAVWFDPNNKKRLIFPYWKIFLGFFLAINLSKNEHRNRCIRILLNRVFEGRMILIRDAIFPFTRYLRKHANS